jgi:hypothetical protein
MKGMINSGGTEEIVEIYESEQIWSRFEIETCGMESGNANQTAGFLGTVTLHTK